ncbi:hypothetical protein [Streptomyces griseus]|uniref:hypothetical protein n=1 Tax=Streptomyces griseus TaxID=1911 RepID=UPI0037A2FB4F
MKVHHTPKDGLVKNRTVGPEYFDSVDREQAVAAGVQLVNALRRFGVDLEGVGVTQVCHTCAPSLKQAFWVELGDMRPEEAVVMATQLDAFATEFQRMRDLLKPAKEAE